VLSNAEKRSLYDQVGKQGLNGGPGMAGGTAFSRDQAEALFAQMFGGQDPFAAIFGEMGGMPGGGRGRGRGGGMGGRPQMHFQFGGMPHGMGGMAGGMGGMGGMPGGVPDIMAQMMGGGIGGISGMGGMPGGMNGMGGGRRRRTPERPELLPDGTAVLVRGLTGAMQHNGKQGSVAEWDAAAGRYVIILEDGEALRIKPDNLLQPAAAEVTGMVSKPELNGQTGTVRDYDAAKGRYVVSLRGVPQPVALKPENLILPKGTRVKVVGLVSQPQWNDKVGKVLDFDRERRRYVVQMTPDQQLSLKLESVLL